MSNLSTVKKVALLAMLLFPSWQSNLLGVEAITQFGITWKFSADVKTGKFVNGDYWVVGPVKIVGITPSSTISENRVINGSMANPAAGMFARQGFDSAMSANVFVPELNAARPGGMDLSPDNPLVLQGGVSLVSTISHPTPRNRPQLTDAAVLTVLSQEPPPDAFRPPYCGSDKRIVAREQDLDYTLLRNLPPPQSSPQIGAVEAYFERPWIEIATEYGGREMHPSNNQPNYGRELSNQLAVGLLSLHLDFTKEQKRTLMIRLVQYGIDVFGCASAGGIWRENGGHNMGRKMPLLFTGSVLKNEDMLRMCDGSTHRIFQEDLQTFYVTQADVDLTNSPKWDPDERGGVPTPYGLNDIGMPEWGITHVKDPAADDRSWTATYRTIAGGATLGHILVAHIMNLRTKWNWEAAFDYYDRFWTVESKVKRHGNSPPPLVMEMWAAYRQNVPRPSPPGNLRAKE